MRVAITGSSGLIGTALVARLQSEGVQVVRLVRRPPRSEDEVAWDPQAGELDARQLRDVDGVVHLAGAGIGERRWKPAQRTRILRSRVDGTALLARTLAGMDDGPGTLVCASGVGIYGDRGEEVLTEDSGPGEGFLAEVCRQWEAATEPARAAGRRVVSVRLGIVLAGAGGALARMLPLFRMGLGGRLGTGAQYWSWIALDDVVGVFLHALRTPDARGPLNGVAPNPVRNADFTRELALVLRRPARLPVPKVGPLLLFGQMARELLFFSQRALPERTEASGYVFQWPRLGPALAHVLAPAQAP